ncbi:tetratricopeptide repeat protein, partial [Sphingomonas sp.]|uniref:tetratricopeptide repeat protein n=1 Tax=Sphingomonas sp. TaxID=28214 RepID=UPI001DDEAC2A|nr:sporulation protein [Sphingomonas sp.]
MRFVSLSGTMALAALLAPAGAAAQQGAVTPVPGEVVAPPAPDADALAAEMRVLATSPNDMVALLNAGELALKLGDPAAAAGFFARAERVDPRSGRLVAGRAALLIQMRRPGEALLLFQQAEALGYDPARFLLDRALAYDLIGEQERAQRDYRAVLKARDTDEAHRRYALSLAISGRREAALAEIDALVRKQDRGAWRVRTFVLAMTGDVAGAEAIAQSMLPPALARGLSPFFARLAQLGAVDRAFAVHFGELTGNPARVADARLAPPLTPLPPEAVPAPPPVAVAKAEPPARDAKKDRKRRGREVAVAATPAPPPPPPIPPPPVLAGAAVPAAQPAQPVQSAPA